MLVEKVRETLARAGVLIDGPNPWDIHVRNERWYYRIWQEGSVGLGESYVDGWWECGRIDELVRRLLLAGIHERFNLLRLLKILPLHAGNPQSGRGGMMIADHHYDRGNDLFFSFLDPYCQYSCAYFRDADDLDKAQQEKLNLICRKLDLKAGEHLLDIGSGWGGLVRYAAERFGVTATGVNISSEQLSFSREFCRNLPVAFLERDYRDIDGTYDKIVSVGMFEHVGVKNYGRFMRVVHRCLTEDGIFLLHTIGSNVSLKNQCDPWIAKYIFPNSMLPSLSQIARSVESLFVIEDVHNLGPHYDRTLMAWHANFLRAWPRLRERYDDRFRRMWEYYLLSCAGAFRARDIQLWQIVMTRQGSGMGQPRCRL